MRTLQLDRVETGAEYVGGKQSDSILFEFANDNEASVLSLYCAQVQLQACSLQNEGSACRANRMQTMIL